MSQLLHCPPCLPGDIDLCAGFESLLHGSLPHGVTLLHCLQDEQEQLLRPILAMGCSVHDTDNDGNAAIHAAALGGHAAVVRMLIMCGADARSKNAKQQDALMCAVRAKRNVIVRPRALRLCS